ELWARYGLFLEALHRDAYQGVKDMAKALKGGFELSVEPIIDLMGLEWLINKIGLERVVEQYGAQRLIEAVGLHQLIEAAGPQKVVEELGVAEFLDRLTPEQRRQFKERLRDTEGGSRSSP